MNEHKEAPDRWWEDAFPLVPREWKAPGSNTMLILVAYDVTDAKRLRKVAEVCEGYGVRVQYSLFECRLDHEAVEMMWNELLEEIDESEDRLVMYRLDAKSAGRTLTAGQMACAPEVVCYLV